MYTGQMKVNATEFKATCLALIDRVHRDGEIVTITKRGRIVARLVRAVAADDQPWLALRGQAVLTGDPFAPVISDEDIQALK
jgi:prevent-host-death family protein